MFIKMIHTQVTEIGKLLHGVIYALDTDQKVTEGKRLIEAKFAVEVTKKEMAAQAKAASAADAKIIAAAQVDADAEEQEGNHPDPDLDADADGQAQG